MLVLTRRSDQSIEIGKDIRLRVLGIKGNSVRLGIEAPSDVRVMRSELTVFSGDDDDGGNQTDTTTQPSAA